ncbi:MAG: DUF6390 family protein [Acidimicrobiia bacterium]
MISGPELFSRYARPPNLLGYCGPGDTDAVTAASSGLAMPVDEMRRVAQAFDGAWPYLELLGGLTSRDPLSVEVVESYWIGSGLLEGVDLHDWGNSVSDRFRRQAGPRWRAVEDALNAGGVPNHAFHVFCVYPWVGLLREGFVGPALEVLDRCRISIGRVVEVDDQLAVVERHPLRWVDDRLVAGELVNEPFRLPGETLSVGETVSLHWDYVCSRLNRRQAAALSHNHDLHLAIANRELRSARLEPAH